METAAIIVHILVSLVIVVAVLLQSGKGGGMGASFGGSSSSQALFGSAGPATLLTKITAGCAVIFMVTSLYITYKSSHKDTDSIMMDVPTVTAPSAQDAVPDPLLDTGKDGALAPAPKAAPEKAATNKTKEVTKKAPSADKKSTAGE